LHLGQDLLKSMTWFLRWQDSASVVWLGYNDPAFLAQRHGAASCPAVENLQKALGSIVEATVKN